MQRIPLLYILHLLFSGVPILFIFLTTTISAESPSSLNRRFPRKVHVTYTIRPKLAERAPFKQLLVLPVPRTDERREIENLRIRLPEGVEGAPVAFPETGDLYLPVVTTGSLRQSVTIEYDATLYAIHYRLPARGEIREYNRDSELYRAYTARDQRFEPDHPKIREIADRTWRDSSDIVDYARRIYAYEQSNLKWKNTGTYGSVSEIFANGGGDCGALTAIYVSLLRNRGIPARASIGGVIRENDGWEWHVWPEFYLEGFGWVEADPSFYTSPPGFFAYDDSMRIHFNRASTVSVDHEDFHFKTGGVQRFAIYRRGISKSDDTLRESVTGDEPLDYDVDVKIKTLSVSNEDESLISEQAIQSMRDDLLKRIVDKRRAVGLNTTIDPGLNEALTQMLRFDTMRVQHREKPVSADCRTGCPDEPLSLRTRGESHLRDHLEERKISFSRYAWEMRSMGFHAPDPAPYVMERLDEKRMLDPAWNQIGVGYYFDYTKRSHLFTILYGVRKLE
jgi:transglutaminase-like putative cysteine protease